MADATNAFNTLNREACLRNMRHLCPSLATVVINSYRQPAKLFVGGSVIMSAEGTTQGDPIAMPMYALGILPLIRALSAEGTIQMWFADDSSAGGRVQRLRAWWDILRQKGPAYGYAANAEKSVLVVKAVSLAKIAETQPQAAYAGFTQGLKHRWSFLCRVMECAAENLGPLEDTITNVLIPALCGKPVNSREQRVLAFPCREGGLGLVDPATLGDQFRASAAITSALVRKILDQDTQIGHVLDLVRSTKREVASRTRTSTAQAAKEFILTQNTDIQLCVGLAAEKGASAWLTCTPLKAHGFALSKGEFRDGLALRYGWPPAHLPSICPCGASFTVAHALSCSPWVGFPH